MCDRKIEECRVCTRKCPQEKLARDIAEGRMYAVNEMIRLQKELQEYKDLEEQGLLFRLPCPIGTTVYEVAEGDYDFSKPYKECLYIDEFPFEIGCLDYIGKDIFLTKAEAEEALKKMQEGSDD